MANPPADAGDPLKQRLGAIRDQVSARQEERELRARARRTEQAETARKDPAIKKLKGTARKFAELILDEFPQAGVAPKSEGSFTARAELAALDKLQTQMNSEAISRAESALLQGRNAARTGLARAHKNAQRERRQQRAQKDQPEPDTEGSSLEATTA